MKEAVLRDFAQLIAVRGLNIQEGQDVVINTELDQPRFVEYVVEACYERGARSVDVRWHHQKLDLLHTKHQSVEALGEVTEWEKARYQHMVDTLPCILHILSDDPDGLDGVDVEKFTAATQNKRRIAKPYRDQMDDKQQWCIVAVPGAAWAKKLFPDATPEEAEELLWNAILTSSRALENPIAAWDAHNKDLHARCDYLNGLGIKSLHYKASNGTDLTVGMMPEGRFRGGAGPTIQGTVFNPNIPSEEVFISPKRGEAEGIVYSSMPLCYQGQLIENFSIRFEGGRAVEIHAEKNEALLKKLAAMDEGAAYLGECALVPYDSPIRKAGILFYNTLFDENAACHLALGQGFCDTIDGFENRTLKECQALGVNESILHEDFMIGTEDLNITAETFDGKTVEIFKNGTWAF